MRRLSVWNRRLCGTHSVALLQPGGRLSEHNHGGGLPDDRHTLQMGRVPVCRQGRPLVCGPQLRLPAAAAGVSDHTTVGGKRPRTRSPEACDVHTTVRTLFWFLDGSSSLLVISGSVHYYVVPNTLPDIS